MKREKSATYISLVIFLFSVKLSLMYEISGKDYKCFLHIRSDFIGYVVFCNQYISNKTSFELPPNITRLGISNVKNMSLSLPIAPNFESLTDLELVGNELLNLTYEMLAGLYDLRNISLRKNFLRKLSADVFKNNLYLESIDLSSNFLLSFEDFTDSFRYLKFLRMLNVADNKLIRWISGNNTNALKDISHLDISGCDVDTVEECSFGNFNNISTLIISANPLPEQGMRNMSCNLNFENLKKFEASDMMALSYFSSIFLHKMQNSEIEYLDLSKNRLSSFPNGRFPQLKELILIGCEIKILHLDSFIDMPKLEKLTIRQHEIRHVSKQFYMNVNLKYIDLSQYLTYVENPSLIIDDYSFKNQKNLEILRLMKVPIRGKLRRYILYGLYNLKSLLIHNTALEYIEDYAFETLDNLEQLDLSYNGITDLSMKSFFGLKNLKRINLSGNELSFLRSNQLFIHTPNLEILNLASNRIQNFPNGIFSKLYHIGMIQIEDNSIQPWTTKLLPRAANMTVLTFDKNSITHFTAEMLSDISCLEFVGFARNPINCGHCSVIELQEWMNTTNTNIVGLSSSSNYICNSPDSLKTQPLMQADLSYLKVSCTPHKINIAKILYLFFSSIAIIVVGATVVWYRWKWSIKYMTFMLQTKTKKFKEQVNAHRYMYDGFVSYCDGDIDWVRNQLIPAIEQSDSSFVLCLPDRDFSAGDSMFQNIGKAVEKSRTTILVLSNKYIESNWGTFEVQMVQNKLFEDTRSGLILIFLEPILKSKITKNLQYVIKTRTCLQWTKNPIGQKLFWERLKLAIRKPKDKGIATHIT